LLQDGTRINTKIVIWAAGVRGNVPKGIDPALVVRGNRIKVDRYNKVMGTDNIYAIGDIASMTTPLYENGHPQLANVAINQGALLGKNLLQLTKNEGVLEEYEYKDKGSMATIGRHKGVVDVPKPELHFGGFLGWLIWMGLHLFLILGVKNRVQVFINWVYNYFTWDQSLRLLIRNSYRGTKSSGAPSALIPTGNVVAEHNGYNPPAATSTSDHPTKQPTSPGSEVASTK
jgi:NADH dehydrogenase